MAAVIHHWPSTHNATDLHISSQDHTNLIERARAALQAISLTCHMLLPLFQRGLFVTVKLTSIGSSAEKWRVFERLQDFGGFSSHRVAQTRDVPMRKQKSHCEHHLCLQVLLQLLGCYWDDFLLWGLTTEKGRRADSQITFQHKIVTYFGTKPVRDDMHGFAIVLGTSSPHTTWIMPQ